MLRGASRDDESTDANITTGLNSHPRREVEGLRGRWWRKSYPLPIWI